MVISLWAETPSSQWAHYSQCGWIPQAAASQIQVSGGAVGRVCGWGGGVMGGGGWLYTRRNDVTELRVSMQATGSDQDKPLGSRAVFSLQGGLSRHTLLYLSTTHICPYFPVCRFLCVCFYICWLPRMVPHAQQLVQKIQVWGIFWFFWALGLFGNIVFSVPPPLLLHICFSFTSWV